MIGEKFEIIATVEEVEDEHVSGEFQSPDDVKESMEGFLADIGLEIIKLEIRQVDV